MASTYENDLRLEEMATGENSGSWGTKTNTNLELIADAFSYGTETIANADTTITIADGAADAARSLALKINSSEDLTTTRVVTLAPNTTSKVWIIENNTSGGQTLTISAGSGSNITLENGRTKIIATDGIGAGSNVVELTQDIAIADLFVDDDLTVGDDIIMDSDGAKIDFGADSEIQLTHVADTGLLLTETGGGAPTLQFRDSALSISSSADGQLDIDSDGTIDINATTSIAFDTDTLYVDSTNDRVGINESSPSAVLHLGGSSNQTIQIDGSSNTAYYGTNGDRGDLFVNYDPTTGAILNSARSTVGIQMDGADGGSNIRFRTTNANNVPSSERMRISSSGQLLSGTTSGSVYYNSVNTYNASAVIKTNLSNEIADLVITNGNNNFGSAVEFARTNTAGNDVRFASISALPTNTTAGTEAGAIRFYTKDTTDSNIVERMRLLSNGNFGLGTSTPTHRLDILNDGGEQLRILAWDQSTTARANVDFWYLDAGGSAYNNAQISTLAAANAGNGNLVFSTRPTSGSLTERLRIDSRGTVGINIVPNDWFSNRAALQLGSSVGAISANNGLEFGLNFYVDASGAISRYTQNGYAFKLHSDAGNDGVIFSTGGNNTSGAGATLSWSERMRLSNSGHVGIGSSDPSNTSEGAGLQVRTKINRVQYYSPAGSYYGSFGYTDNTNTKSWISVDSSYNQGSAVSAGLFLSAWHGDANGSTIGYTFKNNRSDQSLAWSRVTSATSVNSSANEAEFMRLTSGGSLAIGTNTPRTDVKLAVYNDGANSFIHTNPNSFDGTYKSGLRMSSSIISSSLYYQGEIAFVGNNNYSGDMTFSTAPSGTTNAVQERMRITSSGNIGFGITPTVRLHVYGTAGNYNSIFRNGSDSGQGVGFQRADGTQVGSITWASTTVSFNTTSDYRLKENVVELTGATTRLKQLEPKRFNFIADADTTVDGFLAHEVQSVVPEAITGTHNEVDDDGNPVYQGIDQSKLVPLLVATIKELEARITALENA